MFSNLATQSWVASFHWRGNEWHRRTKERSGGKKSPNNGEGRSDRSSDKVFKTATDGEREGEVQVGVIPCAVGLSGWLLRPRRSNRGI